MTPLPSGPQQSTGRTLSRSDGPATSAIAGAEIVPYLSRLEDEVVAAVKKYPACTTNEIAHAEGLRDPRRYGRRMDQLVVAGRIKRGPVRRCNVTARLVTTWLPANAIGVA